MMSNGCGMLPIVAFLLVELCVTTIFESDDRNGALTSIPILSFPFIYTSRLSRQIGILGWRHSAHLDLIFLSYLVLHNVDCKKK